MPRLSIGLFASEILGKPLYPFQTEAGNAILDSVLNNKGLTFSVMMSRQSGKNQLSAVLEAYLLTCMESGTIVKASPTWLPQAVNSKLRLLSMLENPLTCNRYWKAFGYIIGVAPTREQVEAQAGPRIMLFSASPDANIVGATASLLLEVDEAQDVDIDKFDRDLRPMASTTNATTVLYGTAWSNATLLALTKANNLILEEQDGIKRHYEYDWRTLAAINPNYKKFVEGEIQRLGPDHLSIKTQYLLQPIDGAGLLLNELQRHLLRGKHSWMQEPGDDDNEGEDGIYVMSADIAGESRPKQGEESQHNKRDSTIITIGRVTTNEVLLPVIEVVHQLDWRGKPYLEQYAEIVALCEQWGIRKLVIDRTGLGDVMSSLLESKLGSERVVPFLFTRPSKSKLAYQFLGMINSGRLKMYAQDEAPGAVYEEAWKQLKLARYRVPGKDVIDFYCDASEAHDDYLISIALVCEAVKDWSVPVVEAHVIRPRRLYADEGRF